MKQHTGCFLRKTPKNENIVGCCPAAAAEDVHNSSIGEPEVTPGESIDINTPLPINCRLSI